MKLLIILVGFFLISLGSNFASEESDLTSNALNAYRSGDYDSAIGFFSKLIQLNVTDSYLGRGKSYFAKNENDKAMADLNEAIQRRPSAIAFRSRGHVYLRMHDYEKAVNDYSQSILLDSANGYVYVDRANVYFLNRQFAAAKIDCNTAILLLKLTDGSNVNQSLSLAYCIKGEIDVSENKEECFTNFDKAIQVSPANYLPYLCRGSAFAAKGKASEALNDCNTVKKWNPTNAIVYAKIAAVEFEAGDYAKAIQDCNMSFNFDSKCDYAYDRLAWILAVCPDSKIRDGKKAFENAKKACELTAWKEPQYLDALAAACAETGDFENAVKWEKKSIEFLKSENELREAQKRMQFYKQGKPYHIGNN